MLLLIAVSAILSGVDNLQACSAIGLLSLDARTSRRYAIAFSAAEIVAPLLGLVLGNIAFATFFQQADRYGPVVLLMCGLGILLLAIGNRDAANLMGKPGMLIIVPVLLSLDNLLAGIGLSAMHAPLLLSALIIGATGAAMSCGGLYVGTWVRRLIPARLNFVGGLSLCLVSLDMLVKG